MPDPFTVGQATIYPSQIAASGSALVGYTGRNSVAQQTRKSIHIDITEVENGRLVGIGIKQYIVAPGQSLIEVIGQALVEAKLEE